MEITANKKERKLFEKIFELGVLTKAFFGFFEILAGIIFAFSDKFITGNFIILMAQQEIIEDPNDLIANFIINSANSLAGASQIFAVIYLVFHGIVNIFLAMLLLKNKLWAFPAAIYLFGGFLIYQIYRYFHTFSFALLFLIVLDIFVIGIIRLEHLRRKKQVRTV